MTFTGVLIAQSVPGIQHDWWQSASQLPIWMWFAILLSISSAVVFMYWKQRTTATPLQLGCVCLLRVVTLSITVLALINITRSKGMIELPELSIVLDCSQSSSFVDQSRNAKEESLDFRQVGLETPSRINRAKRVWLAQNGRLLRRLSEHFRLKFYCAGATLDVAQVGGFAGDGLPSEENIGELMQQISDWSPNQKESLLGTALVQIIKQNSGTTNAGIVLFSDGALTGGKSFELAIRQANRYKMPVYTVGLGDHRRPKDVEISRVHANDRVLANELLDVTCEIAAHGFRGQSCELQARLMPQGTLLDNRQLVFESDDFNANILIQLPLENQGSNIIEVGIKPLVGELSADNNHQIKVVEVIKRSMRVLLIQQYPTPEFRFLKQSLTRATNSTTGQSLFDVEYLLQSADRDYEKTDSQAISEFPTNDALNDYDVIILGEISVDQSRQKSEITARDLESLVDYVSRDQGNLVLVPSSSGALIQYLESPLEKLLPFDRAFPNSTNPSTLVSSIGSYHVVPTQLGIEFSPLARLPSEAKSIQELSPMRWRVVPQSLDDSALVMAELIDLNSPNDSRSPAISFQRIGAGIVIVHFTDEFYRWRFRNDQQQYAVYWSQLIRYLVNNRIRRVDQAATIQTSRSQYPAGQPVAVWVTVADASAGFDEKNSFELSLEDESGNLTRVFCKRDETSREIPRFEAILDNLNPGHYRVNVPDDWSHDRPAEHEFEVTDHPLELFELRMQKVELENLARATGGAFVPIDDVSQLWSVIPRNRWTQVQRSPSEPIWSWWAIPVIFSFSLVGLLTIEWLLRRKFEMI